MMRTLSPWKRSAGARNRPQASAPAIIAPPSQPNQAVRGRAIFRKRAGFAKTCMIGAFVSGGFGGGEACAYGLCVPKDVAAFPLQQNRLLGIGLRVGAATSFGITAAGLKLAAQHGVSLPEPAFSRFALGLPPMPPWTVLRK